MKKKKNGRQEFPRVREVTRKIFFTQTQVVCVKQLHCLLVEIKRRERKMWQVKGERAGGRRRRRRDEGKGDVFLTSLP